MHIVRVGFGASCVLAACFFAACVGDDPAGGAPGPGADAQPDTSTGPADSSIADAAADTTLPLTDAPAGPRCDPKKPFGDPKLIAGDINSPSAENGFATTSDELVAVVWRTPSATFLGELLYVMRASREVPFGPPLLDRLAAANNTNDNEAHPSLTGKGLTLYFQRNVSGDTTVFVASRATVAAPFGAGERILLDGTPLTEAQEPRISRDGQRLYWTGPLNDNVFMATRSAGITGFASKTTVGTLMTQFVLSSDELTVYFFDVGVAKMRVATRAQLNVAFGNPADMPANLSATDWAPIHISDDDCILYVASDRNAPGSAGGQDIYEARRPL